MSSTDSPEYGAAKSQQESSRPEPEAAPLTVAWDCCLTPEFYELISEADPNAARDIYYSTSEDFTDLHRMIKGGLLKDILGWLAAVFGLLTLAIFIST